MYGCIYCAQSGASWGGERFDTAHYSGVPNNHVYPNKYVSWKKSKKSISLLVPNKSVGWKLRKCFSFRGQAPWSPSSPWCCYITHWNDGSLEIGHLTTRNSESASVSGGKTLTPSPPHVTNNGKHVHVQIINKLNFMQILCHRKERKVGKEIKMLGRGVGRILSWVGEYTPLLHCNMPFYSMISSS